MCVCVRLSSNGKDRKAGDTHTQCDTGWGGVEVGYTLTHVTGMTVLCHMCE